MRIKTFQLWVIIGSLWLFPGSGVNAQTVSAQTVDVESLVTERLETGRLGDAVQTLKGALTSDKARFGLGMVQFVKAVETLSQSLYKYGMETPEISMLGLIGIMPVTRLPVPLNPDPEPITYEAFRAIVQQFIDDLNEVDTTLKSITDETVSVPVDLLSIHLDMDGDGKVSEQETLWRIYVRLAGDTALTSDPQATLMVNFDRADVDWLRAYSHLLMGIGEWMLAHDAEDAFNNTFHLFFPRSNLPGAMLLAEQTKQEGAMPDQTEIADIIALFHLIHWPVIEPDRMPKSLAHLRKMVSLSQGSWTYILAETDNEREWIPGPDQTSALPNMPITRAQMEAWQSFLTEFDALLAGDKLLPHWRFDKGINLARVFTEPTQFDLILWVQGSGALPYLEEGEMTDKDTWWRIISVFSGNFINYAIWLN